MVRILFAVAANKVQHHRWWMAFATAVGDAMADPEIDVVLMTKNQALPDHNKNHSVSVLSGHFDNRRGELTDVNRNSIAKDMGSLSADYIYWWDDDTIHPRGTLRRLLDHDKPFVSGTYYLKQSPYPPVAYWRRDDGGYVPVTEFRRGEIFEVDSVGMGCSLIHRSVFEDIRSAHNLYQRRDFSLTVLPKDAAGDASLEAAVRENSGKLIGGHYLEPLRRVSDRELADMEQLYPYYGLAAGRTEDHWFCELALAAGHKPLLDTSISCGHLGDQVIGREAFLQARMGR